MGFLDKVKETAKSTVKSLDPAMVAKIAEIIDSVVAKMEGGASLAEAIKDEIKAQVWVQVEPMLPDDKIVQKLGEKAVDKAIDKIWDKAKEGLMEEEEEE